MSTSDLPEDERSWREYPLFEALRNRRSRRFGAGMTMGGGPFKFQSAQAPMPLDEREEAALAFAGCGVTGPALADMNYAAGQGGSMLAGTIGRTISSPDAVQTVSLVVINDEQTVLLRRPQDASLEDVRALIDAGAQGDLVEMYRHGRVSLTDGRVSAPLDPPYNFTVNRWSLYPAGSTYFLPIAELTALYINVLLEMFDEDMGLFILDERAQFRPAGVGRFARRRGGHLYSDQESGRLGTVQIVELGLLQTIGVEQGMALQNIGLAAQALGLGGFTHFAFHEFAWFEALGFRMARLPASRYLNAGAGPALGFRLLGRDQAVPYPLGLERGGAVLLHAYCPPYYATMREAVEAFIDGKFGTHGVYRDASHPRAWTDTAGALSEIPPPSDRAVEATIAYCEYLYRRYRRFPVYCPAFRTTAAFQATHVDTEFYDRYFQPEALSSTQREHGRRWHGESSDPELRATRN